MGRLLPRLLVRPAEYLSVGMVQRIRQRTAIPPTTRASHLQHRKPASIGVYLSHGDNRSGNEAAG